MLHGNRGFQPCIYYVRYHNTCGWHSTRCSNSCPNVHHFLSPISPVIRLSHLQGRNSRKHQKKTRFQANQNRVKHLNPPLGPGYLQHSFSVRIKSSVGVSNFNDHVVCFRFTILMRHSFGGRMVLAFGTNGGMRLKCLLWGRLSRHTSPAR